MVGQSVAENWLKIKARVQNAQKNSSYSAKEVCVIGVSKLQGEDVMRAGIRAGVCDLGENYVQELSAKMEHFANEKVNWHFIGALQSNKAKLVVGHVHLIHTVDRESLAQTISKLAALNKIKQKVLIQVNVADEDSKNGISVENVEELGRKVRDLEGLEILGLMTMPPLSDDAEQSRKHFKKLRSVRDQLNESVFKGKKISFLSMGTSQDFEVAVEEGATHVRVGSTLFGERTK